MGGYEKTELEAGDIKRDLESPSVKEMALGHIESVYYREPLRRSWFLRSIDRRNMPDGASIVIDRLCNGCDSLCELWGLRLDRQFVFGQELVFDQNLHELEETVDMRPVDKVYLMEPVIRYVDGGGLVKKARVSRTIPRVNNVSGVDLLEDLLIAEDRASMGESLIINDDDTSNSSERGLNFARFFARNSIDKTRVSEARERGRSMAFVPIKKIDIELLLEKYWIMASMIDVERTEVFGGGDQGLVDFLYSALKLVAEGIEKEYGLSFNQGVTPNQEVSYDPRQHLCYGQRRPGDRVRVIGPKFSFRWFNPVKSSWEVEVLRKTPVQSAQ